MLPRLNDKCELSRDSMKALIIYSLKEKYEEVGINVHKGVENFYTSLTLDIPTPAEMREMGGIANPKEFDEYIAIFAEAVVQKMEENNQFGRLNDRYESNEFDGFADILTFHPKDLENFKTEKEVLNFMMERALSKLAYMTDSAEPNFEFFLVPHMKDSNPHIHIIIPSYTKDYQKYNFYRGKADEPGEVGLIKKLNDWLYEEENQFPFLTKPEHERRERVALSQEAKNDLGMNEALDLLKQKYSGDKYYHADFKKDFAAAGFKLFAKKREISISHNGGKLKATKGMKHELLRMLELYDKFEYLAQSTDDDISAKVQAAAKHINAHIKAGHPTSFEDLNKELFSKFSMYISPAKTGRNKDTQRFEYSQWSLHLLEHNQTMSAKQLGIDASKLNLSLAEATAIQDKIKEIANRNKLAQEIRFAEYKKKKENLLFAIGDGETFEEFHKRLKEQNSKAHLAQQTLKGSQVFNKYDKLLYERKSGNRYTVTSAGVTAMVQDAYASGCTKLEFVGEAVPEIQSRTYIAARLHGMEVINYVPDAATEAKLQEELTRVYNLKSGENIGKIDRLLEDAIAKPDAQHKKILLASHRKFQTDVDYRPKMFGVLYAEFKGMSHDSFMHYTTGLETLSVKHKRQVVQDFKAVYKVTDDELTRFLTSAGISIEEAPKLAQEAPVLTAPKSYDPQQEPSKPVLTVPKSYDPQQEPQTGTTSEPGHRSDAGSKPSDAPSDTSVREKQNTQQPKAPEKPRSNTKNRIKPR